MQVVEGRAQVQAVLSVRCVEGSEEEIVGTVQMQTVFSVRGVK